MNLTETVRNVYHGSDGEATRRLYAQLETCGAAGLVAVELFRAQKSSARAKVYRDRRYKVVAYAKKDWSLWNLVRVLEAHDRELGLLWGWQEDPDTPGYGWVLYVDLPTGQVSFHSAYRHTGPVYPGTWDGLTGVSPERIIAWCEAVLREGLSQHEAEVHEARKLMGLEGRA